MPDRLEFSKNTLFDGDIGNGAVGMLNEQRHVFALAVEAQAAHGRVVVVHPEGGPPLERRIAWCLFCARKVTPARLVQRTPLVYTPSSNTTSSPEPALSRPVVSAQGFDGVQVLPEPEGET